ncbi:hypothetical protein FQR65_LT04839 [Abscondita terminalis]|nr:hypothetical protein FQR65_LT04839 [Abscondita terminalis]
MLSLRLLKASRFNSTKLIGAVSLCTKQGKTSSESSSSSSSSDDEKRQHKDLFKKRSEEAREKLKLLLAEMVKEEPTVSRKPSLELAKARDHRKRDMRKEPGVKSVKTEPIDKGVIKAVQEVAQSLGGDEKQTESELLQKLLNPINDGSLRLLP